MTVNIEENALEAIERLVGENGLYPSRSELIRVAVREFLLKELRLAKNVQIFNEPVITDYDSEHYVKIPTENSNKSEPVREFKTYKILRKLEYGNGASHSEVDVPPEHNAITKKADEKDIDFDFDFDENEEYPESENNSSDYIKPSLEELRIQHPEIPEYKYINEPWNLEALRNKFNIPVEKITQQFHLNINQKNI